ncbi:DEAD/DEAH box helicase, partial [Candidatus Peregrinibacteria bacterium]|nr:DEAD/DEAH box helicase [Candidatus Peregrinibacteria bacterium]
MKTYIALDLETTGFDAETDQVIEVAAIKFQGDRIIDTFETLINPETDIPSMVSHITGINMDMVKNSPIFADIKSQLVDFIDKHPIIGHNIDFDLTFLRSKGLEITNKQFDTFELAGILLPGLPSYSLDTISRILKLKHSNKHRAMSDTMVCFELFNLLRKKINNIPKPVLSEIKSLIKKSDWDLGIVFEESESKSNDKNLKKQKAKYSSIKHPQFQSTEDILDLYDENSNLKDLIPDFETRPSQKVFTEKILDSFINEKHLIAEAGTGTGKTFGYLLPACYISNNTQEKVIISTHTNNLQDQLINKDFPILNKLFPDIKVAILKGKKKYISLTRLQFLKNKATLADFELIVLIKVILWLEETQTGDLDELNLQNKEITLLDELGCDFDSNTVPEEEEYFLHLARKKAEAANIIVVNHALLLQDAFADNQTLAEGKYLIIDEAHHLNKIGTDALTINLTPNYFRKNIDSLEKSIEQAHLKIEKQDDSLEKSIYSSRQDLEILKKTSENLFEQIVLMLNKFGKTPNDFHTILAINFLFVDTPEWNEITKTVNEIKKIGANITENLDEITKKINNIDKSSLIEFSIQKNNFRNLIENCSEVLNNFDHKIIWISKTFDENTHFQS